jgi:hypothetical protein
VLVVCVFCCVLASNKGCFVAAIWLGTNQA